MTPTTATRLDFTEIFDVTQPLPLGGLVGDLDAGTDYSSLCFANSSLFGGISILGGDANGLWIRHVGPDAYSYVLDQNPTGTPRHDARRDAERARRRPHAHGSGRRRLLLPRARRGPRRHLGADGHRARCRSTRPRPTASDNADESWHQGGFTLNLSGSDAVSGFNRWFVNFSGGYAGYLYSSSVTKTYPTWKRGGGSGTYSFSYRAYDKAGNSTSLDHEDGEDRRQAAADRERRAERQCRGARPPEPGPHGAPDGRRPGRPLRGQGDLVEPRRRHLDQGHERLRPGRRTATTSCATTRSDNAGNSESVRSCAVRMVISAKALHRGLAARRR